MEPTKAGPPVAAHATITGRDPAAAAEHAAQLGSSARGVGCYLSDTGSLERLFADTDVGDHSILTAVDRDFNTAVQFRPTDAGRTMLMNTVGYAAAVGSGPAQVFVRGLGDDVQRTVDVAARSGLDHVVHGQLGDPRARKLPRPQDRASAC